MNNKNGMYTILLITVRAVIILSTRTHDDTISIKAVLRHCKEIDLLRLIRLLQNLTKIQDERVTLYGEHVISSEIISDRSSKFRVRCSNLYH